MSKKKIEVSQEFFDYAMAVFELRARGGNQTPNWPKTNDVTAVRLYDEGVDIRRKMHLEKVV